MCRSNFVCSFLFFLFFRVAKRDCCEHFVFLLVAAAGTHARTHASNHESKQAWGWAEDGKEWGVLACRGSWETFVCQQAEVQPEHKLQMQQEGRREMSLLPSATHDVPGFLWKLPWQPVFWRPQETPSRSCMNDGTAGKPWRSRQLWKWWSCHLVVCNRCSSMVQWNFSCHRSWFLHYVCMYVCIFQT